jgi:hypothetical protein
VPYFAKPYTDDPTSPGVPIILSYDVTQQASRSSVGNFYNQIISDLKNAYNNMTKFTSSGLFSKYAARALQAKVYADLLCSEALTALYSTTDVRYTTWLSFGTRGGLPATFINKYKNVFGSADPDDTKIMRMSDVYLIAAEASLPSDETSARSYLNYVVSRRDPAFPGYTTTGVQLFNDIITERRKELAFEGDRYGDLIRLKLDINRSNNYPGIALTLPYSGFKRLFPIPQHELDANKNMVGNLGYSFNLNNFKIKEAFQLKCFFCFIKAYAS